MHEQTEEYPEFAFYDRRLVEILEPGAYVSLIAYSEKGIEYRIYVENSELELIDGIGYELE